jgi:hypothetical protein
MNIAHADEQNNALDHILDLIVKVGEIATSYRLDHLYNLGLQIRTLSGNVDWLSERFCWPKN